MKKQVILSIFALFAAVQLNAQSVWGYVNYFDNPLYPIDGVTVKLYTMTDQLLDSTLTDGNGYYVFNDVQGTQFKIKASTNLPGYSADIVNANEILMFLDGQIEFSTWQYIAADVDGNGIVDMADYQFVAVNHYLFSEPFPAGAWQFSEDQIDLIVNAGGGPTIIGGSRLGDTEGALLPTVRESNNIIIQFSNYLEVHKGSLVEIPVEIRSNNGIAAIGMDLIFNTEYIEVESVDAPFGLGGYHLKDGMLRLSSLGAGISDQAVIKIKARIRQVPEAGMQAITVGAGSHVIGANGRKSGTFAVRTPLLGAPRQVSGLQVMPNPVSNSASIRFLDMPSGIYNIQVINATGQIVLNHQQATGSTLEPVVLNLHQLQKGMYVVRATNRETGLEVSARLNKM
ncbi:MAG: T9SS type A sorting domain-containing protein [Bacteroidetes bacterium]|nr:T9SS type A sorting domain-containing protein [Bacteroidota bacterium]